MKVATTGPVFHLPAELERVYGPIAGHDIRSARGLLEYLISFANRTCGAAMLEEFTHPGAVRPIEQERLRELLVVAIDGPSSASDPDFANPSQQFLNEVRQRTSQMKWTTALERTAAGAIWRHHGVLPDLASLRGLIETLLLNEELRRDLVHCRYRVCDNFFLQKGRKRYCSEECMLLAHVQESAERKNKQRARNVLVSRGYSGTSVQAAVEHAAQERPGAKAKELALYAEERLRKGPRAKM